MTILQSDLSNKIKGDLNNKNDEYIEFIKSEKILQEKHENLYNLLKEINSIKETEFNKNLCN